MLDKIRFENILFLDIETVPQSADYAGLEPRFRELWDKKAAYLAKDNETPEQLYSRAGIFAEFGKIVCISVGILNRNLGLRIKSFYGHDEGEILNGFASLLNSMPATTILCAHNGKEFDFPYLCRRMLINGMKLPQQLDISGKKPWEIAHLDTLELWKFGDYKNYTSINLLAAIFDIPTPKDDIDGSQVHAVYWDDNDLERIKVYCQKDVITLARLLLKFAGKPLISDSEIETAN